MVPAKTIKAWAVALMAQGALGAVLVHEKMAQAPQGWVHKANAHDDHLITLQVGLAEQNLDKLETTLYDVSSPRSKNYGNHMSRDEVESMLAPKAESREAVVSWLKQNGVDKIGHESSWVNFQTTVANANKLLSTRFAHYESEGETVVRTLHYSLPEELQDHVDLVTPTTYFGKIRAMAPMNMFESGYHGRRHFKPAAAKNSTCSHLVTPDCLKDAYNTAGYTPKPEAGSRVGFGSFLKEAASYSDLHQFENRFGIPSQGLDTVLINGGVDDQSPDAASGEASLDAQNQVAMAHPLPVTQYITGGSPPFIPSIDEPSLNQNEPYLPYYQYLLAQENSDLPQVISNSYGEPEMTVPEKYAKRVCNMIGQMGLRGITVLESSGDTGVGAGCKANDGTNATTFDPQFPGTCPYITAVGGTQAWEPEVAWEASSGGFSNYFPRPAYQDDAISAYLADHIDESVQAYYAPYVDFKGRGFPDVSAHSLTPDYAVVYGGVNDLSGGTSAAAPVVAAIVALLNDARLRAGKKTLGFLNPWIYSKGYEGFTDITGGAALGCNGQNLQTGETVPGGGIVPFASWNGTEGWDPATGFGVPDFAKLKEMVLEM